MGYEDSVASVAIYGALCGAGPAHEEEERQRKLKAEAKAAEEAEALAARLVAQHGPRPQRLG